MKLSSKIVIITAVIVMVMGLLTVFSIQAVVSRSLKEQLQDKGLSLARVMANDIANPLLNGDLLVVQRILKAVTEDGHSVEYAFVIAPDGKTLIHTFGDGFPEALLTANPIPAGRPHSIQLLVTEKGPIRDIGLKVLDGLDAELHVGFTETSIQRSLRRVTWIIALLTLGGIALACGAAWLLGRYVVRPLERLTRLTRRIGRGDLDQEVTAEAGDEVGILAQSFNQMIRNLRETIGRLKESEESYRLKNSELSAVWGRLKRREEVVSRLLKKVITAQEEERKRIARELHDETNQSLAALAVGLKAASALVTRDAEKAEKTLEDLKDSAVIIMRELHNIVYDLRPTLLDDLGLVPALRWCAETRLESHGVEVSMEVTGVSSRLPPEVETILFRIGQEAISNIAKYAGARHVHLCLRGAKDHVWLRVSDDGCGFDVDEVLREKEGKRSLGLMGMMERAGLLGGKVEVESNIGAGTIISVQIPISPRGEELDGQDSRALGG